MESLFLKKPSTFLNTQLPSSLGTTRTVAINEETWKSKSKQKQFLDGLEVKLKIDPGTKEGWYSVTQRTVHDHGGGTMLVSVFKNSVYNALTSTYPSHVFLPWKFVKAPSKFWQSAHNQRSYLDWLAKQLSLTSMEDWYKVHLDDLLNNYGGGLMMKHRRSVARALATAYPEHQWLPWLFRNVRKEFWNSRPNRKQYFKWLESQLKMNSLEDWYKVSIEV